MKPDCYYSESTGKYYWPNGTPFTFQKRDIEYLDIKKAAARLAANIIFDHPELLLSELDNPLNDPDMLPPPPEIYNPCF